MRPKVSVVVPTYRRHDLLKRCLTALAAQDFDPAAYEIIVADDAASVETQRLVAQWVGEGWPAIRYIPTLHAHGPAAARNAGWHAARGEIIAFTDDDCVPEPQWLRAGIDAFRDDVAAVWGRLTIPLPDQPTDYERDAAGLGRSEFVTANCFCRREALTAVGGFDERFTVAWREDSDLYFSLLEHHYRIEYCPEAHVVHPIRPAPWGISLRQQRKSLFNALLYKKHPRLYRQRIPPFPRRYYAIVALLLIAGACVLAGKWSWAAIASAAWLALVLHFCLYRLRDTSRDPGHVAEMVLTSVLIPPISLYWHFRGALKFRVFFA